MQIFLVGQPELEEKLWSNDLRQLRERISLKSRLQKLDRGETSHYIARRLAVAGHDNTRPVFTREAIDAIYRLSAGVPRRINILCENALLTGYADNYKLINEEMIKGSGPLISMRASIPELVEETTGRAQAKNTVLNRKAARRRPPPRRL